MRSYEPLGQFLQHLTGDFWRPTIHELERLLGFELPQSAHRDAGWWRNDAGARNPQAAGWRDVGWSVGRVNLEKGTVTFHRGDAPPADTQSPQPAGGRAAAIARERPLVVISATTAAAFAGGLVVGALLGARD